MLYQLSYRRLVRSGVEAFPLHCARAQEWPSVTNCRRAYRSLATCVQGTSNAETRDRTGDLHIFSLTLSQLSYRGSGNRLCEETTRSTRQRAAVAQTRSKSQVYERDLGRPAARQEQSLRKATCSSISGLVVEYIVAIDVTRVRFPADAL